MTNFYDAILGRKENLSKLLLLIINLEEEKIPRFRDVYLHDGKIVVYTRTGGGNREDYIKENEWLRQNENYLSDSDDDFDCTYANFFFKFPDEHQEYLLELCKNGHDEPIKSDTWRNFFENLNETPFIK